MKNSIKKFVVNMGYCSKPDFIILGAQKAGTTGLHNTLAKHSFLTPSIKKEIHYFDNDNWYSNKRFSTYHQNFPLPFRVPKNNLVFETTPLYLYHPKAAHRLFDYNSKLKLILILRDPAMRALSSWTMYHHHFKKGRQSFHDGQSFKEAVHSEIKNFQERNFYNDFRAYVKRGIYHTQIEEYLKYFPSDQLLILESEEFKNNFKTSLKTIFSFLEIPDANINMEISNVGKVNSKDTYADEINYLNEFYKPHNESLFKLIDRRYNWGNPGSI